MKPEVLAPAGSREALEAAVRSGADAVYLGMGGFNARRGASNFDGDDYISAVEYCHIRGVRVYLTLNTLVSDAELESALDCVALACKAGTDAVIVQDLGLARLIRESAPGLRLHASTQLSVHSESALERLAEAGFRRVVLARELDKSAVSRITARAKALGIETEVFVHGALCMCLSGQCYLSGVIGQRSGNRGMCAQPCRLAFADGSYPLSLKDMSLIDHVGELEETGVGSFKIEGRLKRPEYVAAAVNAIRCAVDSGFADEKARSLAEGVFGRSGHTDGYFTARTGSAMFGRRTDDEKLRSAEVLKLTHELYRLERQSVGVSAELTVNAGAPSALKMSDGEHTVTAFGAVAEPALRLPLDAERARALCSKLGNTPFKLNEFDCCVGEGLTLPAAAINELRRAACEQLISERKGGAKPFKRPNPADFSAKGGACGRTRIFARFASKKQLPDDLSGLDRVYLPLGADFDGLNGFSGEVGAELPRAMFDGEENVKRQLERLPEGVEYALCNNIASITLARDAGLKAHAGFGMNVFNSVTMNELKTLCSDITLSFELTLAAAARVGAGGVIAYGRLPLMLTRNCPRGGVKSCRNCPHELVDRKGKHFPLACSAGYSEVLNCLPLALSFDKDRLDRFDFVGLYFTDETPERCREVIDAFADRQRVSGETTRGLYYRGVL